MKRTMTRSEVENRLVFRGDVIARKNKDGSATLYEVICADNNVFVLGNNPRYDTKEGSTHVNYEHCSVYSNDKTINTLESLGFTLLNSK